MTDTVSDEVCTAAIELVLRPLGTSLRHYMPVHKADAIAAMRGVLQAHTEHVEDAIREAVDAFAQRVVEGAGV